MKEHEIIADYEELFNDYKGAWNPFLVEADSDMELHLGAHFSPAQVARAVKTDRSLVPFPKTTRQVELLHGYEIKNRHILKIGATGKEDDIAARQHTGIIMQQMAQSGYDMLSETFKWGALVTGSNLFDLYLDREGRVQFGRRPHNGFMLDPGFTLPDLSDCRHILCGKWLHEDAVKKLLPTEADKIDKIPPMNARRWTDSFQLARKDYMRCYEEWWSLIEEFKSFVINRMNGQEIAWEEFSAKAAVGGARNANAIIETMRLPNGMPIFSKFQKPIRRVELTVFVDAEPVWQGPNPAGIDEYPFVWVGGEWCPECPRSELKLRSLTRKLHELQFARDKRLNQALDIMESSIQAAKVARQGALVNPEDAYKSGQGHTIWVKKDFPGDLASAITQISGPSPSAGIFQLIELLDKEETESTGLNQEVFGGDEKDRPAILSVFRTGQALTAQQSIFQGFRRAKWQTGIKLVKMNQANMTPKMVMRAINEQPAQGFYEPDFTRFDCNPTEGLLTDSQRHLNYLELKELYTLFPEAISPSFIIEAAPVQFPEKLLASIRQKEKMASQMAQAQLQTKEQMDAMLLAQARLDNARAQGEIAGIPLDQAKTMVELQKLAAEPRLGMIDRYLQLLTIMQAQQQAAQQPVKQGVK